MLRATLFSIAVCCTLWSRAFAAGDAFISHGDGTDDAWGRDLMIQETLKSTLGFTSVDLNADTTPGETPVRAAEFLERPGKSGDRRFLWISGPGDGRDSPCPTTNATSITPAVATLILAPECYSEFLSLPPDALHVSLRDLPLETPKILAKYSMPTPAVVVLTLPSDDKKTIAAANRIVLDVLKSTSAISWTPAQILRRLRLELHVNGSDYTPRLDAAPGHAAWSRRYMVPKSMQLAPPIGTPVETGTVQPLRWTAQGPTALYAEPYITPNAVPALWFESQEPVAVLRQGRDGIMTFVRTGSGLFGWVKTNDIE